MPPNPENHLRVAGYLVDIHALLRLEHHCDPHLCRRSGSCCAAHDAWIDSEEHDRLTRRLPRAAQFAPHLRNEPDPCRRLGPDLFVIGKSAAGTCIFAFESDEGETLCSLHAAALEAGESPEKVKPRGCVLWPLCESGSEPPVISVQPGAYDFPCNTPRPDAQTLHPAIAALIRAAYGPEFLRELQGRISPQPPRVAGGRD